MNEDTTTLNETETASKNKVARKVTKKSAAKKKSTKAKTAKATKSIKVPDYCTKNQGVEWG